MIAQLFCRAEDGASHQVAASGRTAFVDHPLHTRFQDLQTGLGHAFVVPDPLAKAVGGHLLGTEEPELVL